MKALPICLLILILMLPLPSASAEDESAYAYHLRVVRVSGAGVDAGAALGWSEDDGEPVMLPEYEAWGSPAQLEGLAHTLGGERATPVTGFFIRSDDGGVQRFERPVYLDDELLDLTFEASPPGPDGSGHMLLLKMEARNGGSEPLAEAKLALRTARTVAIALPSPIERDWLVLAVTLLSQELMDEQASIVGNILDSKDDRILKPALLKKVAPEYPLAAKKAKLQGFVAVQVVLDKNGIPRAPAVIEMSPGCEELAAAAVDAVLQWRYEPARLEGEPVAVYFTINVNFKLS
jgi:TonB family protein